MPVGLYNLNPDHSAQDTGRLPDAVDRGGCAAGMGPDLQLRAYAISLYKDEQVTHVGIYADDQHMIDAPHIGASVRN